MEYDVLITGLKIAGIIVGSLLGVAGVLLNFKNDDGRITKSGIAVIMGILISSTIGVIATAVEGHKAKLEALEQTAQIHQLLSQLNRSIHPITKFELTYWVKLPSAQEIVKGQIDKISQFVNSNLKELLDISPTKPRGTVSIDSFGLHDEPITASIGHKSDLWPNDDLGLFVYTFGFSIFILKRPIDPEDFRPIVSTENADIAAFAIPINEKNALNLDIPKQELYIFGRQETIEDLVKKSGRISAIPDLYGSQMLLVPSHSFDYNPGERYRKYENKNIREIVKSVDLRTIVLKVAEGREIWIDGNKFQKTQYKNGYPAFSIVFPETEEEMQGLYSGD